MGSTGGRDGHLWSETGIRVLNADSSVRHSLAILSMTNDSIRFVIMRQTPSEVLEYLGYATRDKEVNTKDSFLTKGEGYFVAIEITRNREDAEIVYFDDRRVEVERATPDEIVIRHENARSHHICAIAVCCL